MPYKELFLDRTEMKPVTYLVSRTKVIAHIIDLRPLRSWRLCERKQPK